MIIRLTVAYRDDYLTILPAGLFLDAAILFGLYIIFGQEMKWLLLAGGGVLAAYGVTALIIEPHRFRAG